MIPRIQIGLNNAVNKTDEQGCADEDDKVGRKKGHDKPGWIFEFIRSY